jgi:hypothetical protein
MPGMNEVSSAANETLGKAKLFKERFRQAQTFILKPLGHNSFIRTVILEGTLLDRLVKIIFFGTSSYYLKLHEYLETGITDHSAGGVGFEGIVRFFMKKVKKLHYTKPT